MADTKTTVMIEITGNATSATDAIKRTNDALQQTSKQADTAIAKFKNFGDSVDRSGRQTQIALRSIGEVGSLAGLDRSLISSAQNAGMMADAIGDISGALTMVNPVMLAVAAAGVGLAWAFNRASEEQKRHAEEMKAAQLTADGLVKSIDDLSKATDPLARQMQDLFGLTKEQSEALAEMARKNGEVGDKVRAQAQAVEELRVKQVELNHVYENLTMLQKLADAENDPALKESFIQSIERETQRYHELRNEIIYTTQARRADMVAMANGATLGRSVVSQSMDLQKKSMEDAENAAKKYADALKQVQSAQDSLLRGMVERALSPTSVTADDMAAGSGYKDKWDENRRRLEAVAKGTDPSTYGAKFTQMFSSLKMSAEDAARAFKDFSLFANPKNLNLVDWGAFAQDIGQQLLGLVGKANLMKEGFNRAWASLSNDQRKALRELGVESAGDAKKVLMGTSDNLMTPFNDKEQIKKFQATGAGVVGNLKSGMLDKETMKTFLEAPQTLLQNMLGWFALPDSVKAMIDTGAAITTNIAKGITDNASKLSDALVAAVFAAMQAATDAATGGNGGGVGAQLAPVPSFANGGAGIVKRSGFVKLDAGETFFASGVPPRASLGGGVSVTVNYSPGISLGTRAEATSVLAPMIVAAVKDARARKQI